MFWPLLPFRGGCPPNPPALFILHGLLRVGRRAVVDSTIRLLFKFVIRIGSSQVPISTSDQQSAFEADRFNRSRTSPRGKTPVGRWLASSAMLGGTAGLRPGTDLSAGF